MSAGGFRDNRTIKETGEQSKDTDHLHDSTDIHEGNDYNDDFDKLMDEDDNDSDQMSKQEKSFSDRMKQFKAASDATYSVAESGTVTVKDPSLAVIPSKLNPGRLPDKDDSYLPGDERGHIEARSENGLNQKPNIVAQAHDVNHGPYLQMEKGEKNAVLDGATVFSEKIAFVSNQPGKRADAFMVNDTITYSDGKTSDIHLSFQNIQDAEQESFSDTAYQNSDMLNAENPNDKLRDKFSVDEYGELMEATYKELPNIADEYDEPDNAKSTQGSEKQESNYLPENGTEKN